MNVPRSSQRIKNQGVAADQRRTSANRVMEHGAPERTTDRSDTGWIEAVLHQMPAKSRTDGEIACAVPFPTLEEPNRLNDQATQTRRI
jgi:hypothetical protein